VRRLIAARFAKPSVDWPLLACMKVNVQARAAPS
jgi:hypothetical protein